MTDAALIIQTPEPKVTNELVAKSQQYATIADDDSYQAAAAMVTMLVTEMKEIDNTFDPSIRQAHETHKTILAAKKKHCEPREKAIDIIKRGMGAFLRLKEQERLQAEAAARELARKEEEERLLASAVSLEAEGELEQAEALINEPVRVVAPYVPPTAPVVSGISSRETWDFRIVNEALIPRQYLCVNEQAIRGVVKSLKSKHGIPGVEAFTKTGIAVRTK